MTQLLEFRNNHLLVELGRIAVEDFLLLGVVKPSS